MPKKLSQILKEEGLRTASVQMPVYGNEMTEEILRAHKRNLAKGKSVRIEPSGEDTRVWILSRLEISNGWPAPTSMAEFFGQPSLWMAPGH